MNDFRLSVLKPHYEELFSSCQIRSSWLDHIAGVAQYIVNERSQYDAIEAQTTVPWWFIAILHYREANFENVHLHNGDSLTGQTINPPQGRPLTPPANGMSYTFAESAVDAMQMMKYDKAKDRSIPAWLWRFEMWDGFDYASRGMNSEYLWSGTNHYGSGSNQGKFLADGQFDPNAKSDQAGAAAIIWYLLYKGIIDSGDQQSQSLSTASANVGTTLTSVGVNGATSSATLTVNQATGQTVASIELMNVLKYYRQLPHQELAIAWLQQQLPNDLLAEFARRWRTPDPTPVAAPISSPPISAPPAKPATLVQPQQPATASSRTLGKVQLKVPYLTQLDNTLNPYGTCNVTSVAMCMSYFGHPTINSQGEQLEDELNTYCNNHGLDRHVGEDLAKVLQAYGYKDDFQTKAKWEDVKKWLDQGNPCIVHGYFTSSGHIVAIIGYNEKGWIVNDPYGEWFASGYDTSSSGAGLTYSYGMMREKCGTDGDLWIHFVSK